jgi:hypothetical protein
MGSRSGHARFAKGCASNFSGAASPAQPKSASAATDSEYCTAKIPGEPIEQLFWSLINSGQLARNYQSLIAAIKARGEKVGKVPKIVLTTYHQPLTNPDPRGSACIDAGLLANDKLRYLISLENTLKTTLMDAVRGIDGVTVAHISNVIAGHEWCTSDPWAYGLTVLVLNATVWHLPIPLSRGRRQSRTWSRARSPLARPARHAMNCCRFFKVNVSFPATCQVSIDDRMWPKAPVDRRWVNDRYRGEADGRLRRACYSEGSNTAVVDVAKIVVALGSLPFDWDFAWLHSKWRTLQGLD